MKYSELVEAPKLAVRSNTAIAMIENGDVFAWLVKHGWLRPLLTDGRSLYAVSDLEAAVNRLKKETLPE